VVSAQRGTLGQLGLPPLQQHHRTALVHDVLWELSVDFQNRTLTTDHVCTVQEEWLRCAPVLALQQNLGLERQAAFSFCYTWLDEVPMVACEQTTDARCKCSPPL
jgi:hypothetical protein